MPSPGTGRWQQAILERIAARGWTTSDAVLEATGTESTRKTRSALARAFGELRDQGFIHVKRERWRRGGMLVAWGRCAHDCDCFVPPSRALDA